LSDQVTGPAGFSGQEFGPYVRAGGMSTPKPSRYAVRPIDVLDDDPNVDRRDAIEWTTGPASKVRDQYTHFDGLLSLSIARTITTASMERVSCLGVRMASRTHHQAGELLFIFWG
jgi:hypothetical protein